jgi:VIT1/CCC1 family predicted Fe2+/Mn2+ transporter/rubrerythrin
MADSQQTNPSAPEVEARETPGGPEPSGVAGAPGASPEPQTAAALAPGTSATRAQLVAALQQNWLREMEGARTYRELAAGERDAQRRQVLERLAQAEQQHATRWERKLAELGATPPPLQTTRIDRMRGWLRRGLGTDAALRRMEADEDRDIARYEAHAQAANAANEAEVAGMMREVRREEEAHGRLIHDMLAPAGPQGVLDVILRREHWHKRGGGWLGDAIYGANDGLGAVFGIVAGVAGATASNSHVVLIAGLAGMLASALSMGSGAYLATKSEREVYQAEINRERREIEEDPAEEREELALFYQLKGFSEAESQLLAERLSERPEQFLRTLAHEELGLSEESFPNPVVSAVSAAISTGVGAFIPILPFFWIGGWVAIVIAAVISLVAHFAVGAAKTLVTGRSWLVSGTEMTVVGFVEAVITYFLGVLFHSIGA